MRKINKMLFLLATFLMLSGFTTADTKKEYETEDVEICSTSNVKTYMDYRAITNKQSTQWKYIEANMTVDENTGLLLDDEGFIGVALGSYFGKIGTRYYITLDTGLVLPLVKVEAKADKHVSNGCEHLTDKSVIEMVIDEDKAAEYFGTSSNGYVSHGNFNRSEHFKGSISKVELVTDVKIKEDVPVLTPEPTPVIPPELTPESTPEAAPEQTPDIPENAKSPESKIVTGYRYVLNGLDNEEIVALDENLTVNDGYCTYVDKKNNRIIGTLSCNAELTMKDGTVNKIKAFHVLDTIKRFLETIAEEN